MLRRPASLQAFPWQTGQAQLLAGDHEQHPWRILRMLGGASRDQATTSDKAQVNICRHDESERAKGRLPDCAAHFYDLGQEARVELVQAAFRKWRNPGCSLDEAWNSSRPTHGCSERGVLPRCWAPTTRSSTSGAA